MAVDSLAAARLLTHEPAKRLTKHAPFASLHGDIMYLVVLGVLTVNLWDYIIYIYIYIY